MEQWGNEAKTQAESLLRTRDRLASAAKHAGVVPAPTPDDQLVESENRPRELRTAVILVVVIAALVVVGIVIVIAQ